MGIPGCLVLFKKPRRHECLCYSDIERRNKRMDLRHYYRKIREMESNITDEYPLVVSFETGDGGKSGICTEVPRRLAAKRLWKVARVWPPRKKRKGIIRRT